MQVQVKTNVLAKNDAIAESLQQLFKEKNIFVFNLLGSPGAGKTSLLEATLQDLKKDYRLAVIEGDLFTAKDAKRIHELGVPVIQINTVGGCHLDAQMIQDALGDLNLDDLDMIIIENVGNLVCPAEFEIGESMKVTKEDLSNVAVLSRLSVPEEKADTYLAQMDAILTYMDNLSALDTENVKPTTYALPMQNVFREDEVRPSLDREAALSNAPLKEDGYFKVPCVLGE